MTATTSSLLLQWVETLLIYSDIDPRLFMYLAGYGGPPPAYSSHASAPPPAQAGGELPPAYSAAPDNTLVGASTGAAHPQVGQN